MPLQLVRPACGESSPAGAFVDAKTLVGESNHRIANNLAVIAGLVRLEASRAREKEGPLTSREVHLLLQQVAERIETVSRLHRLLVEATRGVAIDLGEYLRDVADAIVSSLAVAGQAKLQHTFTRRCMVPAEAAISIGLIVGEMVTNAVKYAHPSGVAGRISVGCSRAADNSLVVEVADDGVGLPEGFDPERQGSLGFMIMRSLAGQLGAALDFDQNGLGLVVRLRLPAGLAN
jgi:two-component sensor histidine kinase